MNASAATLPSSIILSDIHFHSIHVCCIIYHGIQNPSSGAPKSSNATPRWQRSTLVMTTHHPLNEENKGEGTWLKGGQFTWYSLANSWHFMPVDSIYWFLWHGVVQEKKLCRYKFQRWRFTISSAVAQSMDTDLQEQLAALVLNNTKKIHTTIRTQVFQDLWDLLRSFVLYLIINSNVTCPLGFMYGMLHLHEWSIFYGCCK